MKGGPCLSLSYIYHKISIFLCFPFYNEFACVCFEGRNMPFSRIYPSSISGQAIALTISIYAIHTHLEFNIYMVICIEIWILIIKTGNIFQTWMNSYTAHVQDPTNIKTLQ